MIDNLGSNLKQTIEESEIIFDSVPAWIFYKNKENRFIRVNKAFCDAMGKTKAELEDKSLFDIYSKEEADKFLKDDKEVIASGKSKLNIIELAETPMGQKWVQTDKIPYLDKQGNIIGVIGFSIDITERKTAEVSTQKSQLILQGIIDLLPVRIFWKDINLKYLGCNKAFAKDAGKESVEEIIGKDDFQMGWKEQADLYRKDDMIVINTGVSKINYEEEQTTPDGNKIWLITNKMPLKNNNGEIQGILGTYMDITDQRHKDDKLKTSLEDIKKANQFMVDRELMMIQLKNKIVELENKIKSS